ncbi:hypothetical protein DFH08DRAFT_958701 [Mycena albidolilacea]|uniref:Uncharacterized protein n=1 Tax=Mycena albidolilacea TaxID=1033008 RepID=A0AAD7A599_9AGAR|nr:hypothetical protein DFH08DRAFT_958701 [Mycena albidolilacea]
MQGIHDPAVEAMEIARAQASLSDSHLYHQHGNWASLTTGGTRVTGCNEPGNFVNRIINTAIIISLVSNIAFINLAEFASGAFLLLLFKPMPIPSIQPFLHLGPTPLPVLYQLHGCFLSQEPQSPINSTCSVCTFDLGPCTCAFGHRNFANLGWWVITALGTFNYTKGGNHIILDCKLILEFPLGCTVVILSAAIFHSNTWIAEHETRYSFTQYTMGASAEEIEEECKLGLERAVAGATLFSTLDELKAGWV